MKGIDQKLLRKFLALAGDRLKGRWVLLGGTLLPLVGVDYRVTTDIDLVGLGKSEMSQALELMKLVEELGLPVEAINLAAGHFLEKLAPYNAHLVPLHRGRTAEILRPDLCLFLMLKLDRLSDTDLLDCLALLKLEGPLSEKDRKAIEKRIQTDRKRGVTAHRDEKLAQLLTALEGKPAP